MPFRIAVRTSCVKVVNNTIPAPPFVLYLKAPKSWHRKPNF